MPRQLLLEGPAIEPLLARVREEHGTAARIVKAERVRVGGVGGFFAKVRFEVTIEVTEAGAAAGGPSSSDDEPDLAGLAALLSATEDAERSGAPAVDYSDFWAGSPRRGRTPVAEELIRLPPAAPLPAIPAPRVPVAVQASPPPAAAPAPVAAPVVAAVPGPEVVGLLQEAPVPRTPPPAPVELPADPVSGSVAEPSDEVPTDRSRPAGRHSADASVTAPSGAAPATAPDAGPDAVADPDAPLPTRRSRRRETPAGAAPAPLNPPPATTGGDFAEQLGCLGVHRRWLRDLPDDRTEALRELASRLAARPATPRRAPDPGDHPLVVVIAESGGALPTTRTLAVGMGLPVDEVVVIADDAPAVEADLEGEGRAHLVDLARQRSRPVVVHLAVPFGADAGRRAAARGLLTTLRVDQLWAVVDATRRTADVEAWLRDVAPAGGVDAVSLVDTAATAVPAAGLDLAAPVALLEGRPATPAAWVSLLAARLTEDDLARHLASP